MRPKKPNKKNLMRPKHKSRPEYPRIGKLYRCPQGSHPLKISIHDLQEGQIALRIYGNDRISEGLFVTRTGKKLMILNSSDYYPNFFAEYSRGVNLDSGGQECLIFPSNTQITLKPWMYDDYGQNQGFTR